MSKAISFLIKFITKKVLDACQEYLIFVIFYTLKHKNQRLIK